MKNKTKAKQKPKIINRLRLWWKLTFKDVSFLILKKITKKFRINVTNVATISESKLILGISDNMIINSILRMLKKLEILNNDLALPNAW